MKKIKENEVEEYICPNCKAKDKYVFNETSHADKIYSEKITKVGYHSIKEARLQTVAIRTKIFKECLSCGGYRTLHSENSIDVPKKERNRFLGKGENSFSFN